MRFTSERPVAGLALVAGRYQRHARERDGDRAAASSCRRDRISIRAIARIDGRQPARPSPSTTGRPASPQPRSTSSAQPAPRVQRRQRPARHSAALLRRRRVRLRDRRARGGAQLVGRDGRRAVARSPAPAASGSSKASPSSRAGAPSRAARRAAPSCARWRATSSIPIATGAAGRDVGDRQRPRSAGARDDLQQGRLRHVHARSNSSATRRSTPRRAQFLEQFRYQAADARRCRSVFAATSAAGSGAVLRRLGARQRVDRPGPRSAGGRRRGAQPCAPRRRPSGSRCGASRQRRTGASRRPRSAPRRRSAARERLRARSARRASPTCSAATTSCRGATTRGRRRGLAARRLHGRGRRARTRGSRRSVDRTRAAAARRCTSWVIDRGLAAEPAWSADGTRVLAVESARGGQPTLAGAERHGDGSRQTLGHDRIAAADGRRDHRRARGPPHAPRPAADDGARSSTARAASARPLAAPNGGGIAYALVRDTQMMDLRVLPGGRRPRAACCSPGPPARRAGAGRPTASRLFAALPGDWDWQLWELPLDGTRAARAGARGGARSPTSPSRPTATASPSSPRPRWTNPLDRTEVFVIDARSSDVRRFN